MIDGSTPRLNEEPPLPFKPRLTGGGSEKGKPQGHWPYFLLAAGCGFCVAWNNHNQNRDRRAITPEKLMAKLEMVFPGIETELFGIIGPRSAPYAELLKNRFYKKEAYSGTSDRRGDPTHDPLTRPKTANEHFHKEVPADHAIWELYRMCETGVRLTQVKDWKERWLNGEWSVETYNSRTGETKLRDRQNWYRARGHERPKRS